jgi:16S rRNA A1518/A1519 N6-dimethyltransferase RsmA/KsgA/DIM1 with predicted DNA glycosylase/AP lyase activity
VKAGFGERRKQLHNSLSGALWLEDEVVVEALAGLKIDPKIRPQDLDLETWAKIYHKFKEMVK